MRYFQEKARISQLKNNHNFFDSIPMLGFGETKVKKEKFYAAKKHVNVDTIVISKLYKTKIILKLGFHYRFM